jgi:hypothetical protein
MGSNDIQFGALSHHHLTRSFIDSYMRLGDHNYTMRPSKYQHIERHIRAERGINDNNIDYAYFDSNQTQEQNIESH